MGVVIDANNNRIMEEQSETAAKTTGRTTGHCLILHYTHEKRFAGYKRDLHQIWSETFVNTPALEVKLIVGNRNNRHAKHELVRKRPHPSLLNIKDS